MFSNRRLALLGAVVALLALGIGSGSFTAMDADRGSNLDMVSDQQALLGVQVVQTEAATGETFTLLELTDRFEQDVDLDDVSIVGSAPIVLHTDGPADIGGVGDPLAVEAECTETGDETVTVRIEAGGGDVQVTKEKDVGVNCTSDETVAVYLKFNGCGSVKVTADANGAVELPDDVDLSGQQTLHVYSKSQGTETIEDLLNDLSESQAEAGPGGKLVAVTIDGELYVNPNNCADDGLDLLDGIV